MGLDPAAKLYRLVYINLWELVMSAVPEGFQPHPRKSGFTAPWEPIYQRPHEQGLSLGLRAGDAHANSRGFVHGGLISTLCDNAMGLSCAGALGGIKGLVTVNLSMDFLGTARVGQWLEVRGVQGPGLDRAAPVTPPVSAPPPHGRHGVFCSFRSGAGGGPGLRAACWWE